MRDSQVKVSFLVPYSTYPMVLRMKIADGIGSALGNKASTVRDSISTLFLRVHKGQGSTFPRQHTKMGDECFAVTNDGPDTHSTPHVHQHKATHVSVWHVRKGMGKRHAAQTRCKIRSDCSLRCTHANACVCLLVPHRHAHHVRLKT